MRAGDHARRGGYSVVCEERAAADPHSGARKKTHWVEIFDGGRFHSIAPRGFSENATWGWDRILLQSRTGEWWGATNRGLCRYGSMKAEDLDRRAPQTCYSSDTIFRIFEDSKGGIWASAQSKHGDQMGISVHTVRFHLRSIYEKNCTCIRDRRRWPALFARDCCHNLTLLSPS